MDPGQKLKQLLDEMGFADVQLNTSPSSIAALLRETEAHPEISDIRVNEPFMVPEVTSNTRSAGAGGRTRPPAGIPAVMLKESANEAFKAKNYRNAINLYSQAFDAATPNEIELKRTILANRAQSYIFYGDIHTAFQDVNLALSSEYTSSNSPKGVSVKCHARKAKLLCIFARYEVAMEEYAVIQKLRNEPPEEDKMLKKDIDKGLGAPEDSKLRRRDELLRAVDARGLIVQNLCRTNFPAPPAQTLRSLGPDFRTEDMCLTFATKNHRVNPSLPNANDTPISFPVFITAPYFQARPNQGDRPFRTRQEGPVSETKTVGSILDNIFSSHLLMQDTTFVRQAMPSALDHESPEDSLVIMPTHRSRLLVIPRKMTFKQVFSMATWPRKGPPPFQDLREVARAREFEVDGIELVQGWHLDVIVIPKDKVGQL